VVFFASNFLCKNLDIILRDYLYYFVYYLILILIAKKEKDSVLGNCDFAKLVSGCSWFSQHKRKYSTAIARKIIFQGNKFLIFKS
jgi:hypothetical protein